MVLLTKSKVSSESSLSREEIERKKISNTKHGSGNKKRTRKGVKGSNPKATDRKIYKKETKLKGKEIVGRSITSSANMKKKKDKPLVDFSPERILNEYVLTGDLFPDILVKKDDDIPSKKTDSENRNRDATVSTTSDMNFQMLLQDIHTERNDNEVEFMDIEQLEYIEENVELLPEIDCSPTEEENRMNKPINNERFEEIGFYCVNRPFAYIKILRDKKLAENLYIVIEPHLTDEEQRYFNFIKETLDNTLNPDIFAEKDAGSYVEELIDQIISDYNLKLAPESKKKIVYLIKRDAVGYGKIDALTRDPYIEDISCDGSQIPIFIYHRDYGSMKTNIVFKDEEELSSFVIKLAQKCGKYISVAEPMLDGTLPDGSRIQATLGTEVTARGSTFTIRKFRAIPFSPFELVKLGTLSPEMLVFLWFAVENGANGIFAGGTGSGKTTTLNAMALFIPREAKIVSIEETREINLPHPNWIPSVTRSGFGEVVADKMIGEIDMYDLLKAALRQRPEYIIVGEIRGREAYVLFQAMATGHTTYSTMHADSPQSLVHRLESKPMNVPRIMIQSLDFICFHSTVRMKNKRVRKITRIIEIIDIDPLTKEIITNEVFSWDPITDTFRYSGRSYILEKIRSDMHLSREDMIKELDRRIKLTNWLIKKGRISFRDAAQVVEEYRERPNELLQRVNKDG